MARETQVCTTCGYTGYPKTKVKGSLITEIILWLLFLVPGILYSIWRLASKEKACPKCGHPNMIPIDTPMGRKLVYETAKSSQQTRAELMEDPVDKWEREQAMKNR